MATYDHPATVNMAEFTKSRAIDEAENLRARAAYFACVDYIDEILSDLLRQLEREGFLDDTIVVYTSYHGELAGEHGLWDKMTWHEASCRVPLMVQLPEHRSGEQGPTTLDTPVSLIDLFPTFCGFANVDAPDGFDGVDLSSSIRAGSEPDSRPIFVDGFFIGGGASLKGEGREPEDEEIEGKKANEYRMVREGDYKYVRFRDAPGLLFNLSTDPLETENFADDPEEGDVEVLEELRSVVAETIDFDEVDEIREEDAELEDAYRLGTSQGDPNLYHVPDGRVVNADSAIYDPHEIVRHPDVIYDDFHGRADDE